MTYKPPSPSLAMRFNDADKSALRDLAASLNRSQTDVCRILVREARHILPELKRRAANHPQPKAGRPKKYSLSERTMTAKVRR